MTVPELLRHAQELSKMLEEEAIARKDAAEKTQKQLSSHRRRF